MSPNSDKIELAEKLDVLIAIQKIAHRSALERERAEISKDVISSALLERGSEWIDAGDLQKAVAKAAKTSTRTVARRTAELVDRGLMKKDGSGAHIRYRSTGLIDP